MAKGGIAIINPLTWVAVSYGKKDPRETNANVLVKDLGIYFAPSYLRNDRLPQGTSKKAGEVVFGRDVMADHPLLEGVQEVAVTGVPGVTEIQEGQVLIWGEVKSGSGSVKQPYFVLVPHGKGYVIGFQHGSFFGDGQFADAAGHDNAQLWSNLLRFVNSHRSAIAHPSKVDQRCLRERPHDLAFSALLVINPG